MAKRNTTVAVIAGVIVVMFIYVQIAWNLTTPAPDCSKCERSVKQCEPCPKCNCPTVKAETNCDTSVQASRITELERTVADLRRQLAAAQSSTSSSTVSTSSSTSITERATIEAVLPRQITPIRRRNELGDVLRRERMETGIEVGVSKGQFAQQILKRWTNFKKYYLVDAWQTQKDYHDVSNLDQKGMNAIMQETKGRMNKYGDKVVFIKAFSNVAVTKFDDESIDYIYIDARHDYNGVYEDCTLFWKKLRYGGIMAGHDYLDQPEVPLVNGRQQDWTINGDGTRTVDGRASRAAVEDFARKINRQLTITYKDETNTQFPTWYLRK
eukprot:TRINITY_DN103448_c0_g1_i1.p1 TRINITY_DN103448_c0_g1~~TRINITY_DN103448_c0_g1_i1.p1  ORF type:complete len:326 (-),score=32.89 TRINITY_DN103448_c0_g1_i1:195-1172(-)